MGDWSNGRRIANSEMCVQSVPVQTDRSRRAEGVVYLPLNRKNICGRMFPEAEFCPVDVTPLSEGLDCLDIEQEEGRQ